MKDVSRRRTWWWRSPAVLRGPASAQVSAWGGDTRRPEQSRPFPETQGDAVAGSGDALKMIAERRLRTARSALRPSMFEMATSGSTVQLSGRQNIIPSSGNPYGIDIVRSSQSKLTRWRVAKCNSIPSASVGMIDISINGSPPRLVRRATKAKSDGGERPAPARSAALEPVDRRSSNEGVVKRRHQRRSVPAEGIIVPGF